MSDRQYEEEKQNSSATEVQALKGIFPDTEDGVLHNALRRSSNNVEAAVDLILSGEVTQGDEVQDDEAVARQLQQQIEQQEKDNAATDELLARALAEEMSVDDAKEMRASQNELDELLAQQLYAFHRESSPPVPRKDEPAVIPVTKPEEELAVIDEEALVEITGHVKGDTVPGFEREFGELELAAINQKIDSPFGWITCGVDKLSIDKVTVRPESVQVTLQPGNKIELQIDDISASVHEFKWFYQKETFPKIEDDGLATAKFDKGQMLVVMGLSAQTNAVVVVSSVFKIGQLEMKISGTKASFIYNLLISAFDKTIQSALEKEIAEMIEIRLKKDTLAETNL